MKKSVIRSTSNIENAREDETQSYWFTVLHDEIESPKLARVNPWNQDESELEREAFLCDDCVIVIRPARHQVNQISPKVYEKDRYFLEISNQDGSQVLSSCQVFTWESVNELLLFFKGISFLAAVRVWRSKKLGGRY